MQLRPRNVAFVALCAFLLVALFVRMVAVQAMKDEARRALPVFDANENEAPRK